MMENVFFHSIGYVSINRAIGLIPNAGLMLKSQIAWNVGLSLTLVLKSNCNLSFFPFENIYCNTR